MPWRQRERQWRTLFNEIHWTFSNEFNVEFIKTNKFVKHLPIAMLIKCVCISINSVLSRNIYQLLLASPEKKERITEKRRNISAKSFWHSSARKRRIKLKIIANNSFYMRALSFAMNQIALIVNVQTQTICSRGRMHHQIRIMGTRELQLTKNLFLNFDIMFRFHSPYGFFSSFFKKMKCTTSAAVEPSRAELSWTQSKRCTLNP